MAIFSILAAALAVMAQTSGEPAATDAPRPGTVTVALADGRAVPPDIGRVFADAVERALLDADFTALPAPSQSRYVAEVTVTQDARGLVAAEDGGSSASPEVSGGRLRLPLPSNKSQLQGLVVTKLTVRILLRATGQAVWSGSAVTAAVQGAADAAPAAIAAKLANVLIRRFPAKLDGPITVP
ncbi:MAG TPA: hypothetical protein VFT56_07615 [Sphingomonas sp.]|nr:hypothetical protein [Sphingomonas sp.]